MPSQFITDMAGNGAVGSGILIGQDEIQPRFESVRFNDLDGDGEVSLGDTYTFTFSEPITRSALSDNTNEANTNLSPAGLLWGTTNKIRCNEKADQCTVTITSGFNIVGNEKVTASNFLTDNAGNTFSNTIDLTLLDSIAPKLIDVSGTQNSPVPLGSSYQITVQFDSSMDVASLPSTQLREQDVADKVLGAGTWSSRVYANDTYVTPLIALNENMIHRIAFYLQGGQDVAGNTSELSLDKLFEFYVQPGAPTLTAPNLQQAPQVNLLTDGNLLLTGTRAATTSVWVNDSEIVPLGEGSWSVSMTMAEGSSSLALFAKNAIGTASNIHLYNLMLDSTAPQIVSMVPSTWPAI